MSLLENAYNLLTNRNDLDEALDDLSHLHQTPRRHEILNHFRERYLKQPPEQIGGVRETIANYLQYFLTPEIAQIFCAGENTFDFGDIDRGKIICVAMPQKYQTERRYVNTFLKMLFYTHVLRRFDKPKDERARDNLLVLWADEAQRFMTASEEGMSDYNSVDVIREAGATVVAATQSTTSFIPPLGKEKARVLSLNLRNRLIFKAADEEGALESADFLGKRKSRQTLLGLLRRKTLPKLHPRRRTPPQTLRATQIPQTHLHPRPLRERPQKGSASANRARRESV